MSHFDPMCQVVVALGQLPVGLLWLRRLTEAPSPPLLCFPQQVGGGQDV